MSDTSHSKIDSILQAEFDALSGGNPLNAVITLTVEKRVTTVTATTSTSAFTVTYQPGDKKCGGDCATPLLKELHERVYGLR